MRIWHIFNYGLIVFVHFIVYMIFVDILKSKHHDQAMVPFYAVKMQTLSVVQASASNWSWR